MKSKKIFLVIVALVELGTFRMWLACQKLGDSFHFTSLDMRLKLEEAIHNDVGFSPPAARFFHNKVAFFMNAVLSDYLRFWDIRFTALFFTIIGYFGIICGFWYLIYSGKRHKWVFLAILLLLPFIEIFRIFSKYELRLVFLTIPYFVLSIFGIWKFALSNKHKGVITVIFLIIISVWYQIAFHNDIFLNCFKR